MMESLLTYIIQVNLLLTMIYIGYVGLLKGLTFYVLNRGYFLIGGLFAFIYPFLNLKSLFAQRGLNMSVVGEQISFYMEERGVQEKLTLAGLVELVFIGGAVLLLFKFLFQLASLVRIHLHSTADQWKSYFFRNVFIPIVPFSFLNKIYVNKGQHLDAELRDIFKHEDIHVKGLHSLDILLFEIILICCWYNPLVWFIRRAIRQNLEFLTDQQVLNKGIDKQAYQYSLLNVSKQGTSIGLSNQFNFKLLRRRISMMNKKRSSKIELSKYAFLLPVFLLTAAAFTVSKAEGNIEHVVEKAHETTILQVNTDTLRDLSTKAHRSGEDKKPIQGASADDTVGIDTSAMTKGTDLPKHNDHSVIIRGASGNLGDVLLVVDGTLVDREQLNSIASDEIESIYVLKDKTATAVYGDKGKNGVLVITTKTGNNRDKTLKGIKGEVSGLTFKKDSIPSLKSRKINYSPQVLYIIDGIRTTSDVVQGLDAVAIERIHIIKDTDAHDKYGQEGKHGVIEITTKKWIKDNPSKTDKSLKMTTSEYTKEREDLTVTHYKKKDGKTEVRVQKPLSGLFHLKPTSDKNSIQVQGLSGKTEVLYVVDGKVKSESFVLDDLKAHDILSVTINKNNALAAAYGTAGGNGVIKVVTKSYAKDHPEQLSSLDH